MDRQGHPHPHPHPLPDARGSEDAPGLETCRGCRRPFVVPLALLDLVDEGLYLLALECKSCGRLAIGEHEDAEVERLEAEMTQAAAQLEATADFLEVSRLIDELVPFDGLSRPLVLPEDF